VWSNAAMRWAGMRSGGIAFAAAALLGGCASGPANVLASGEPGAPGIQRFLICAPNLLIALPAELQGGTGPLRTEIEAYLRYQGREVESLDLYESKQAFATALARAKEQGDIAKTPALFAAELSRTHTFDALVMPSILLHKTRVTENDGDWDGVSRRMRMVNVPSVPKGVWIDTLAQGVRTGGVSAEVPVTSVHVMVFSRDGARVFEGRGGIEFIQDIDLARVKSAWRWQFRLRDDLFKDTDALREGIELAFDPFLTRPKKR
jgi:hypothetical protein